MVFISNAVLCWLLVLSERGSEADYVRFLSANFTNVLKELVSAPESLSSTLCGQTLCVNWPTIHPGTLACGKL